jgi:RAB protein geranylgeranyltransferase component A
MINVMIDDNYDIIILGTGIQQVLLSCALSTYGFKILHLEKFINVGSESNSTPVNKILFEYYLFIYLL